MASATRLRRLLYVVCYFTDRGSLKDKFRTLKTFSSTTLAPPAGYTFGMETSFQITNTHERRQAEGREEKQFWRLFMTMLLKEEKYIL